MALYYGDIKRVDVANGPGVRVSLFVSGCRHRCPECFNPDTWDFTYGVPYTQDTEDEIIKHLSPSHIRGLSLLGGEPLEPENQEAVLGLIGRVRRALPGKTIWCYTGFLYEALLAGDVGAHAPEILKGLDVLVDGPFVIGRKNLSLRFRGSDNQRIIDVAQSLAQQDVVLWDEG